MTCTLKILGCSGGIGQGLRTTAFLLDDDTLIDCGTGVGDLTLDQLQKIDQVFLTHSHLDHITCLPFMIDAVGANRTQPLKVYGLKETLDTLKAHIFNGVVWPDFTRIPNAEAPWVTLHPIEVGTETQLNHKRVTALPACHSIPGVGYAIDSGVSTLAFTGDSGPCKAFCTALQAIDNLKHLLVETSFIDAEEALALISGHYHPAALVDTLTSAIQEDTQIWISHLKPGSEAEILKEIYQHAKKRRILPLEPEQTIRF